MENEIKNWEDEIKEIYEFFKKYELGGQVFSISKINLLNRELYLVYVVPTVSDLIHQNQDIYATFSDADLAGFVDKSRTYRSRFLFVNLNWCLTAMEKDLTSDVAQHSINYLFNSVYVNQVFERWYRSLELDKDKLTNIEDANNIILCQNLIADVNEAMMKQVLRKELK